MDRSDGRFYFPELDCLRFIAFFGVFIYHLNERFYTAANSSMGWMLSCLIQSGVFGVDLFFCLSSFLITLLLLREYDLRGFIDVRAFWMRRILRIWPLYFAFLLLSATVISRLLPQQQPYWFQQQPLGGWQLLHYCIFLGNWDCITRGDWLHCPAGLLWSVSVEEQFYLVWPLLLLLVKPKRILPLAVAAVVGANVYRVLHHPPSFVQQWCNTLYHIDSIAWGVIGACLAHSGRLNLSLRTRRILLLIGMLLIPTYFSSRGFEPFFDGKDLVIYPISSVCCVLIVMSLYNLQVVPWDNVFMKGWAYLGRISYGLYVFHMLAITWVVLELYDMGVYRGEAVGMFAWIKMASFAATLVMTIFLAWVSYTFLERPFLKLKQRHTIIPSTPQTKSELNFSHSQQVSSISKLPGTVGSEI
jgi:peptidoglycan/LPS O-acetylase OafA/YrhL